jgi:demethylmenaquinone methyltransferase/2-methoxy-6-polyprenyl-1,4-benzoquinol methylase/phosphoethanolamine N-methyltransferase
MNSFHNSPGENFVAETDGHTIHTWAKYYDLVVSILSLGRERKFREATLELITIEPGMNILDVGCGTGSLTIASKQKQGDDGEVVGIDPSSNMVDLARRKAEKTGLQIDFRVGVIENLVFEAERFDLVLSSLMMHHLTSELKELGLREVHRVLKPGGKILIVELDPGAYSLASLVHGHSAQLSAELESTRQIMEELAFGPVESGSLGFRGFSYLKGIKQNSSEV